MSAPHEDLSAEIAALRTDDGHIDARLTGSGNTHPSCGVAIVDREQCRAWRVAVNRGATQRELAEALGVAESTVAHHVNDGCQHVRDDEIRGAEGDGR